MFFGKTFVILRLHKMYINLMNTKSILFNLLAVATAIILIRACYKNVMGYTWMYDSLLKGNYELISKHKNLTVDERKEMKMGFTFAFLKFVRDNTPEDAIILFPGRDVFFPEGQKSNFNGEPTTKLWCLNTLYPRKIVYVNEVDNIYSDRITHVAIVDGWGYDRLNYEVPQKIQYAVFPLNQNK
jgi:hypothetical protein